MRSSPGRRAAALIMAICALAACSKGEDKPAASATARAEAPETSDPAPAPPAPPAPTHEELVARGRSLYMSNCAACHNANPTQIGSLGPAVSGSSRELLEYRVVRGDYPPGYTPKRDTRQMVPLPHLAGEIAALVAYLDQ
jgi:mono/diheme cytochrome c family protein